MTEDHASPQPHRLWMLWLFTLSFLLITPTAFAISSGPSVPSGNSTQSLYCSDGICHTPSTPIAAPVAKTTSGQPLILPAVHPNLIGIQLSEACLRMVEHGDSSHCLTYKQLKVFDTTNPLFAGMWVDTPYTHRLPPKVKDMYRFNDTTVVMVDPDVSFSVKARMIIVGGANYTYTPENDYSPNGGLNTTAFINQSVINCGDARISSDMSIVNATLKYLESGCTVNPYNNKVVTYHPDIPFSYDNPQSTLHQLKYLSTIFHGHSLLTNEQSPSGGGLGPGDCIHTKCKYTDPYKKQGW